jgi:hypothetical protein
METCLDCGVGKYLECTSDPCAGATSENECANCPKGPPAQLPHAVVRSQRSAVVA